MPGKFLQCGHCPQVGSFAKGCEHSPGLLLIRDGRYWVIIPRPKGLTINYQFFVNFPMLPSFSDAYTHHGFKVNLRYFIALHPEILVYILKVLFQNDLTSDKYQ